MKYLPVRQVSLASRPLRLADTPGHARHHHCNRDARSRGWFAVDTFGSSCRDVDSGSSGHLIEPAAAPVQFNPAALKESMAWRLALEPRGAYIARFGRVGDVRAPGLAAGFDRARR